MEKYTGPARIAHRGLIQRAPENTLEAFRAAYEAGLEGVELDVRLSRDGEVVVVHDANLTRLTLGHPTGQSHEDIAGLDWEALSRVEIPYANHLLDERPPAHSEIEELAMLPNRILGQEPGRSYREALSREPRMASLLCFRDFVQWLEQSPEIFAEIEIKASGAVKKIMEILDGSTAVSRCIVFSGERDYIREIQETAAKEGRPKGLKSGANIRFLGEAEKCRISQMDLYEVGLNDRYIRTEDVTWLSERGIAVFSNLGDYPEWWETICRLNIQGFKTNYAGAFTQWQREKWNGNEQ